MARKLFEIAAEVRKDWVNRVKSPAYSYLCAMSELETLEDKYYLDSAVSIVRYFLANASTWRGETARRIKKELNDMLDAAKA